VNKNLPALGLMALLSPTVFAGTMGPVAEPGFYMFVLGEGNYTWNQRNGIDFVFTGEGPNNTVETVNILSRNHDNGWGGRLAVGAARQISASPFFFSGEVGYGYFGNTDLSPIIAGSGQAAAGISQVANDTRLKAYVDGFDVLVGPIYTQPMYDLFFKAGALVQNSRGSLNSNIGFIIDPNGNDGGSGLLDVKLSRTQVMPEIKLGGSYHINPAWSLTAAWTHAFGDSPRLSGSFSQSALNVNLNLRNPTLDVASLGLQYNFA
jgi:hypothetical protein